MIRQRVRIRFRKDGDLRLISHRDLARVFERMFRRAGLKLSMSEGFHPKARVSFPSALSLGIASLAEVLEFDLAEIPEAAALEAQLKEVTPPGLTITELRLLDANEKKCRVEQFVYEFPVPQQLHQQVADSIANLMSQDSLLIEREGKNKPVDLRAGLDGVELDDDRVRFRLWATREASVRPREVLEVLGLASLEKDGHYLTRTDVVIFS
ncbi:MAG: radical SAM-linked protein [Pirellulaceae bacterium]|jgi:radical SAM-linked protein